MRNVVPAMHGGGARHRLRAMQLCAFAYLAFAAVRTLEAKPKSVKGLPKDLTEISLDQLSQIKVTSVAKKQQDLSRTAAAVYVVTADDIRRSGATSLPEALRLVPGLHVAKIDASKWAVSSRGFAGRFSNKHGDRIEYEADSLSVAAPVGRDVYGKLTWSF